MIEHQDHRNLQKEGFGFQVPQDKSPLWQKITAAGGRHEREQPENGGWLWNVQVHLQRHASSKPTQTAPLTGDGVFKSQGLWGTFSFKPSYMMISYLRKPPQGWRCSHSRQWHRTTEAGLGRVAPGKGTQLFPQLMLHQDKERVHRISSSSPRLKKEPEKEARVKLLVLCEVTMQLQQVICTECLALCLACNHTWQKLPLFLYITCPGQGMGNKNIDSYPNSRQSRGCSFPGLLEWVF